MGNPPRLYGFLANEQKKSDKFFMVDRLLHTIKHDFIENLGRFYPNFSAKGRFFTPITRM